MAMTLDICVVCHNFQHRLCWMLNSILQQNNDKIPVITFSIAYLKRDKKPTCEEIADFYSKWGLNFHLIPYDTIDELQFRGLVRNRQIKESTADWILFADADMVYSQNFFVRLKLFMEEHRNKNVMFFASRYSCDINMVEHLVNLFTYPTIIYDVENMVKNLPNVECENKGAGFFHLVERRTLKEFGKDLYIEPEKCGDNGWSHRKGQRCWSDRQFRERMPVQKLSLNDIGNGEQVFQWHLRHQNDFMNGKHLEDQR